MLTHLHRYGRPTGVDGGGGAPSTPLEVTGQLPGYTPSEAYEGRLQIANNIGKCRVEIVSSDGLPDGAYAFVDNFENEVVLRWPAFSGEGTLTNELPNADFEDGDNGAWYLDPGWSIGTGPDYDTYSGSYSLRFANYRGVSAAHGPKVPCTPGRPITASCQIQQGASSEGNVVARVILNFSDAGRNPLPGGEGVAFFGGNLIRSNSGGSWGQSTVTCVTPADAAFVNVSVSANRKNQNHPLWVDAFVWDHEYPAGLNEPGREISVTLKVTDAANQVAYWTGTIEQITTNPLATSILSKLTQWWEFDNSAITGSQIHGSHDTDEYITAGSSPPPTIEGVRGSGDVAHHILYPGSGGHIVGSPASMQVASSDAWCLWGWVYMDNDVDGGGASKVQVISECWDNQNAGSLHFAIQYSAVNGAFYLQGGGSTYANVVIPATSVAGNWHFFVVWRDPVDGKLHGQINNGAVYTSSGVSSVRSPGDKVWRVGYSGSTGYSFRGGRVSRWGITRGSILTPEERAFLYNSGLSVTYPELVALA